MKGFVHVGASLVLTSPEGARTERPGLGLVDWFAATFCGHLDGPVEELAAEASGGVIFVPSASSGMFSGMSDETELGECARALFEGLVHTAAPRLAGARELEMTGAAGQLLPRLFAEVVGVPVACAGTVFSPDAGAVRTQAALGKVYRAGSAALAGMIS